jgi:hypothetical protein
MEKNLWLEDLENNTPLCIDCFQCKIKNNKVFCKYKYFTDMNYRDVSLFTPFDFDCWRGSFYDDE